MQLQLPQLWLLDLRPLMQDERWRAFLPELPIERQTRARSCRREEDAARLTGAGFLLQQALLSLNIPVSEQIFRKNDCGKPYLVSHAVEFSLTHAAYYAACALDTSSVGLDLEAPRITMAVANRCFHPTELTFLKSLPEPEQPDALLRLWTIKEAYTKQLGSGLHIPLDSFYADLRENGLYLYKGSRRIPVHLHEYRLDSLRLCLCSNSERPEITQFIPNL